jgi:hypothetical protein
MPPILRSRLALVALLGAFLIPIGMSSLRGLTHVLSCEERSETPFSVAVPDQGRPEKTSSTRITRPEAGEDSKQTTEDLCGGLTLSLEAPEAPPGAPPDEVVLALRIRNDTDFLWRGTVTLVLGSTPVPVDIGEIPSGETETDEISFKPDPGTLDVEGSLLIGP